MKRFHCSCGAELFFDSRTCVKCERKVAFDIQNNKFVTIDDENKMKLCQNGSQYNVCNWVAAADSPTGLCLGCEFNRIIPDLNINNNVEKWAIMESSKKRLLYSLKRLGVPFSTKWLSGKCGFLFDFIEDKRTNPTVDEQYVTTGYSDGIITININEADPVFRTEQKEATNQSFRTVLGHFRHESGHHYYNFINLFPELRSEYNELFCSSHTLSYDDALVAFYANGPKIGWEDNYITPYASAHHLEDWAETWSHYLHILDSLETAIEFGFIESRSGPLSIEEKVAYWQASSIGFNEINRSLGIEDNYPFVINQQTIKKLKLIEKLNVKLRNRLPDSATD